MTLARSPSRARKTVTVVFSDVAESTRLGSELDPEAVRSIMSRYFEAASRAVEHHGGTVEKFIGDAVMAVFGIPAVHEDDALRAVRAVVEMHEAVEELNRRARAGAGHRAAASHRREHGRGGRRRPCRRSDARHRRHGERRRPSRAGRRAGRDPDRRGDAPARAGGGQAGADGAAHAQGQRRGRPLLARTRDRRWGSRARAHSGLAVRGAPSGARRDCAMPSKGSSTIRMSLSSPSWVAQASGSRGWRGSWRPPFPMQPGS